MLPGAPENRSVTSFARKGVSLLPLSPLPTVEAVERIVRRMEAGERHTLLPGALQHHAQELAHVPLSPVLGQAGHRPDGAVADAVAVDSARHGGGPDHGHEPAFDERADGPVRREDLQQLRPLRRRLAVESDRLHVGSLLQVLRRQRSVRYCHVSHPRAAFGIRSQPSRPRREHRTRSARVPAVSPQRVGRQRAVQPAARHPPPSALGNTTSSRN